MEWRGRRAGGGHVTVGWSGKGGERGVGFSIERSERGWFFWSKLSLGEQRRFGFITNTPPSTTHTKAADR